MTHETTSARKVIDETVRRWGIEVEECEVTSVPSYLYGLDVSAAVLYYTPDQDDDDNGADNGILVYYDAEGGVIHCDHQHWGTRLAASHGWDAADIVVDLLRDYA